ncbi:MAG TPA: hypothetical protein VJ945_00110, partial [Flavobacteriaceae bacterium]|nr:hypothetical protein [Flavobacteriaceae bacterium]
FAVKNYKIQHHKAHFASVLGEHHLFKDHNAVLGVIWDGTGYGDDKHIWGGEFFEYKSREIKRISHFEYFDWLAGDKMSKEPRISLFSLADETMITDVSNRFSNEEMTIYQRIKKQNTLKTSSVGRLFDAVASLLDLCRINTYEGEAAIILENHVMDYRLNDCKSYATISDNGLIPTKQIIKTIFLDLKKGATKAEIIVNFLYTLADIIFKMADKQKTKSIALSGGVFQNTLLIDILKEMAKNDYKLFFNCNLSPNDENISFGQIMYYLNIKESE